MKEYSGGLDAGKLKIGIVVSRFNEMITERLLEGALGVLRRSGIREDSITIVRVPGSFEVAQAAQQLIEAIHPDAVVCLGALIRGETPHFDYLARQVTLAIGKIALRHRVPVAYGIITAETVDQAINRAGAKQGNKGAEAAVSAIEMANLFRKLTTD